MSGRSAGVLLLALCLAAPAALAKDAPPPPPKKADDSPPPPPPPPPPPEESRTDSTTVDTKVDDPTSGSWSIRGQNSLLDTGTGHTRKSMVSFFIGVPWGAYYGAFYASALDFQIGARFYLPLFKEGFLPMLNDSFGVEFGADLIISLPVYPYSLGFGFVLPAEARWSFHLFPKLEVYAKVGLGLGLLVAPYVYGRPVIIANVGAIFKLNESFYVRAEVGSPAAKIGIGFAF